MNVSRRAFALGFGLVLTAFAGAGAQRGKPPKPDKEMKEIQKAEEKQEKDIAKAQKDREKAIEKAQKEANGEVIRRREPKNEEHFEHASFESARHQSEQLVRGVHLLPAQRSQYEAIRKRYDAQYKSLERDDRQVDKSGGSDAAVFRQLDAARAQERAELRAILTPEQQRIFDRNGSRTPGRR